MYSVKPSPVTVGQLSAAGGGEFRTESGVFGPNGSKRVVRDEMKMSS
jgi:hypothetical protein